VAIFVKLKAALCASYIYVVVLQAFTKSVVMDAEQKESPHFALPL